MRTDPISTPVFDDGSGFELPDGSRFKMESGSFTREDQIRYVKARIAGYLKGTENHQVQIVKLQGEIIMWKGILESLK